MRKQTKLVAVLSTAALLAIGASMTSFAATGWQEEDGTWVYYDNDEERVTETWKRSGNNWFWLDDNGEMAVDQLIEDDENYYYVNESGAMVSNQWVSIENEDAGEEDEPDVYWYYFQSNGKAYKRSDSASEDVVAAKTINGKKYSFDTEGRMLYGWVSGGERQTGDDAWKNADYYFGDENDGAMAQGWTILTVVDDEAAEDLQPGDEFWDEEQDRYFYFQTSGKKVKATEEDVDKNGDEAIKTKTIDGRKYGFDQYGRMIGSWYKNGTVYRADENSTDDTATQGNAAYSHEFMYFNSPEDGARVTKDWFHVVPGYYLDEDEYNNGEDYWYYADGKGNLYTNTIESIKGKKYAFDQYGRMIDGLALLEMKPRSENSDKFSSSAIERRYKSDEDASFYYDTEDNFDALVAKSWFSEGLLSGQYRFCYFGDESDGSMKTGKQTVTIDGDSFTFKFEESGSKKGAAIHGEDDDKIYAGGKLIEADKDDKYQIVRYTETKEGNQIKNITIEKLDIEDLKDVSTMTVDMDKESDLYKKYHDDDAEVYVLDAVIEAEKAEDEETEAEAKDAAPEVHYYLVNTSGTIVKNKTSAKNGEDYKFTVVDQEIKSFKLDN